MITYSVDSRGAVVGDNAETVRHYVHRDSVERVLAWVRNPANASGSGQLNTGIVAWEQDLTDLLNRINAASRQERAHLKRGRAS